jgi:hypothetical protein
MTGIILSLDPGITTGRSLARIEKDRVLISCSQARWTHLQCLRYLEKIAPQHLIIESFEYRNTQHRGNLELYPREMIAIARLYKEMNQSKVNLYMQTAAQGKAFYSEEKLKSMGVYDSHNRHGRDAVKHLLNWWTFGPGYQYNQKQSVQLVDEVSLISGGILSDDHPDQ